MARGIRSGTVYNAFEENEITVGLVPDLADAEIKRAGNGRHGPSQDILSGCRET